MIDEDVTRRVVAAFLEHVRSGRDLDRAPELMAPVVSAHQVESEHEVTIERSPADYAQHVRDMLATWGDFHLEIDEFLVDGARAYVRLTQTGRHLATVDGYIATGKVVRQINSIVYHVQDGVITQYWMQIDRAGLTRQLQ